MLIFYKFKSSSFQTGSDVHEYNTRQRHQHRQSQHRLEISASLPQNMGPKLFNKLPDHIKLENNHKIFKNKLKKFLVEESFYSVGEFLRY